MAEWRRGRVPSILRLLGAALAMLPAACAPAPSPPDTASLPPGSFGLSADPGDAAEVARRDWNNPGATYGHAAEGARAVALLEVLSADPTPQADPTGAWSGLAQARRDVRAAVGIAPDARSQAVVDSLARVYAATEVGDTAAALAALRAPAYTLGAPATLQRLANLPYVRAADIAATQAEQALSGVGPGQVD